MPPKKRKVDSADVSDAKKLKESGDCSLERADTVQNSEKESEKTSSSEPSEEAMIKCLKPPNLKIASWNVNGIRAWIKKNGLDYLKKEQPDIMALQEVKASDKDIPTEARNVSGYHSYWQATEAKGGYAGVGLYTKTKPLSVTFGMGIDEHDQEGRLVTAEYDKFYFVAAYVPNSGRGLVRLSYRQKWNSCFLEYIKGLDAKKPVIYTGDLNVAHKEIDLKNPKTNTKTAGFTKEERKDFTTLLHAGFMDTYRRLYPKKTEAWTFWTYMGNARAKNIGWRLDYFVLSKRLAEHVCDSEIHSKVEGSDHCPITLTMSL